ncbi:hypothetical protein [Tenacibaculum phage JQ]|nr:hypothetical protein [Tenacibaculum phage JQ]
MKEAKAWFKMLDACFLVATGYSMIEVLAFSSIHSITEYLQLSKIGSVAVVILTIIYWLHRLVEWWGFRKYRKEQELIKSNILRIEEETKLIKLKRLKDFLEEE